MIAMIRKIDCREFLKTYLRSWDTVAGLVGFVLAVALLPEELDVGFLKALFSVSVGALSIIFAVYFAALTTVTSSGNDDFITFLDFHGHLLPILRAFRVTLLALFIALIYAFGMFAAIAFAASLGVDAMHRWTVIVFSPLAAYSLVAALMMALDAIQYAQKRAMFFRLDPNARHKHMEEIRRARYDERRFEPGQDQTGRDCDDC